MAYEEALAERLRGILMDRPGYSERKMFGGIAFMLSGNMCCGIAKNDLMLRLGADLAEEARAKPHVRPMDFTGRPIKSMVYIAPEGFATEKALREWVNLAAGYAQSLPAK